MKATTLIEKLQEIVKQHGDLDCVAFQHPEESEGIAETITTVRLEDWQEPMDVFIA